VALERAAWLERRYGAQIDWMPFDLHPEYPPEGIAIDDLSRRYGHDVRESQAKMFAAAGLPNADRDFVPNSHPALNVAELARDKGVLEDVHQALMRGYWAEARDIGDAGVLADIATPFGLDPDEVREVVASGRYEDHIRQSTAAVLDAGAGGVPAFVVDDRFLIPGAQPHELFTRVLEKLGYQDESV
jgi:predicted DsbA family dithiol-disulfide isomerase